MASVAGISFILLIYIGFGEANRSYEQFYVGKLTAQAKVLVNAVESFLKRDLPLDQYVGFRPRAERLLSSDQTISSIAVFDSKERPVFVTGDSEISLLPRRRSVNDATSEHGSSVRHDDTYLQVALPLENDRETIGRIAVSMPHLLISKQVEERFLPLVPIGLALSIGFGLFVGSASGWLARQRWPVLQMAYAGLFLVIAALVVGNLVTLYAKGTQIKTKALADSLGHRMTEVVGFNLDIAQIPGLDRAFSEYRRLNPDIAAAAMVVDDTILIHTDSFMVGRPWESTRGVYEYLVDISPRGSDRRVLIAVTLPQEIVYRQTLRSVKNFAALFIASAFLASLFLQLAGSVNQRDGPGHRLASEQQRNDDERSLRLVKPVFYVTMCVEHLSYAFLASYIADIVESLSLPPELTSTIFTAYYLGFALTLIPAGHLAQRFSPKPLMIFGLFLSAVSFFLLCDGDGIWQLVSARATAGIGQAMLFIGIQSFILSVAAPERKTQGAAIIVYGFQGGMISGMAIGSLLVGYIGPSGVFAVGAIVITLTMIYAVFAVPVIVNAASAKPQGFGTNVKALGQNALLAIRNPQLLQAITLIGIPAKAVLTGIVVFAIPLLMTREGYRQEDIGQILMLYAACVVLANEFISRWVDRTGDSRLVLILGAVLSGAGLWLIGWGGLGRLHDIAFGTALDVTFILIGIVTLGLAHGLINAPIVSHVAALPISERIGVSALTASYRFLERIGHVAGPLVIGQMFILIGEDAIVLAWSGLVIAISGLIYLLLSRPSPAPAAPHRRPAETPICAIEDVIGLQLDHQHQALVLALRPAGADASPDPAQAILLHHLHQHGCKMESVQLRAFADKRSNSAKDVTDLVADRRRALRFKHFLTAACAGSASDRPHLLIVCSAHLDASAFELSTWLDRRPDSRLVVMPHIRAWLDQLRGWIALLSLDSSLGDEHGSAEALKSELKAHLDRGGGQLVWMGTAPLRQPERRAAVSIDIVPSPVLRAVGD
ncbi:MAG: MFS transporter [Rhizobiales bacterium]|nr:MFS transporter [Hyphomicrobiales bacterium]